LTVGEAQSDSSRSRTGPPLRLYSSEPKNYRLKTKIDGKVLVKIL